MAVWTPEEDKFMMEHYQEMEWSELAKLMGRTKDSLKCHAKTLGIKKHEHGQFFTPEEDAWLIENVQKYRYCDLVPMFSQSFNRPITEYSLRSRATYRLGLQSGRKGFQKGMVTHNHKPIGHEMYNKTNGYWYVKVRDTGKKSDYVAKHRLLWEEDHGELPKGWCVIFLDNNQNNLTKSNLYAVPRKIHARMCNFGWYSSDRDLTLSALKVCELYSAIREINE